MGAVSNISRRTGRFQRFMMCGPLFLEIPEPCAVRASVRTVTGMHAVVAIARCQEQQVFSCGDASRGSATSLLTGPISAGDGPVSTHSIAEVDGNRTRLAGIAYDSRFEGGGAHQVP